MSPVIPAPTTKVTAPRPARTHWAAVARISTSWCPARTSGRTKSAEPIAKSLRTSTHRGWRHPCSPRHRRVCLFLRPTSNSRVQSTGLSRAGAQQRHCDAELRSEQPGCAAQHISRLCTGDGFNFGAYNMLADAQSALERVHGGHSAWSMAVRGYFKGLFNSRKSSTAPLLSRSSLAAAPAARHRGHDLDPREPAVQPFDRSQCGTEFSLIAADRLRVARDFSARRKNDLSQRRADRQSGFTRCGFIWDANVAYSTNKPTSSSIRLQHPACAASVGRSGRLRSRRGCVR